MRGPATRRHLRVWPFHLTLQTIERPFLVDVDDDPADRWEGAMDHHGGRFDGRWSRR